MDPWEEFDTMSASIKSRFGYFQPNTWRIKRRIHSNTMFGRIVSCLGIVALYCHALTANSCPRNDPLDLLLGTLWRTSRTDERLQLSWVKTIGEKKLLFNRNYTRQTTQEIVGKSTHWDKSMGFEYFCDDPPFAWRYISRYSHVLI